MVEQKRQQCISELKLFYLFYIKMCGITSRVDLKKLKFEIKLLNGLNKLKTEVFPTAAGVKPA